MRKGSRKYDYNRVMFGQHVRARRQSLGWSYRQLAQRLFDQTAILIAAPTILHVERGTRALPDIQRNALNIVLKPMFNPPCGIDMVKVREAPSLPPSPMADDPLALETMSRWEAAKNGYLRLAAQAKAREMWPEWAGYCSHAGMMEMMLGRYEESAALFDEILRMDSHFIGQEALSENLQNRGWLEMAQHNFSAAAFHLLKSDDNLRQMGMSRTRTFHFLGRTYCAQGIAQDNERYREAGRRLLMRAYTLDEGTANLPSLGYDLLQQIPSMIYDDIATARRLLHKSQEMLGIEGFNVGHFHLKHGLVLQYSDHTGAREHWEMASKAYSQGMFYGNGVGETLRLLSRELRERTATLPEAASYALVAAIAHPYAESMDLLEEISSALFFSWCSGMALRHTTFWIDQLAKVHQMDEMPFALLRALAQRPDGSTYIRTAMQRAQTAIRDGLPTYLTPRESRIAAYCLPAADVP